MTKSLRRPTACFVLIAALALPLQPWAADVTWDGGAADGAWETGANWSVVPVEPDRVPTSSDDVFINNDVVTSSGASNTAENLMTLGTTSLSVTGGLLDILDTLSNAASVAVTGGLLEADTLINEFGAELDVTGAGATIDGVIDLLNDGTATVELAATMEAGKLTNTAVLVVKSGAQAIVESMVNELGGTATFENMLTSLSVIGAGSVGDPQGNITNSGTLTIQDNATGGAGSIVNSGTLNVTNATFTAGSMIPSSGTVNLNGAATVFTISGGIVNQGTMTAATGASASFLSIDNVDELEVFTGAEVDVVSIKNFDSGKIDVANKVAGTASRLSLSNNLENLGSLTARDSGLFEALSITSTGSISVASGGSIETASTINSAGATVQVSGVHSAFNLTNHYQNDGGLTISDHGSLSAASVENTDSIVVEDRGSLATDSMVNTVDGSLTVSDTGSMVSATGSIVNRGSVEVNNGGTVTAASYDQLDGETVLDDGSLEGSVFGVNIVEGELRGVGDISGGLNVGLGGGGSVLPGTALDPTKTLDVDGVVNLAGTFFVDIAGLATDAFDRIVGTGAVNLGGTLDVSLLGGFSPGIGENFDILLGSSVNGAFAATLLPIFDGKTFAISGSFGDSFLRLTVTAVPIPGAFYLFLPGLFLLFVRRPGQA